jgi:hypothetical protein
VLFGCHSIINGVTHFIGWFWVFCRTETGQTITSALEIVKSVIKRVYGVEIRVEE